MLLASLLFALPAAAQFRTAAPALRSVPVVAPMPAPLLSGIQRFLASPAGTHLVSLDPSLALLRSLDPKVALHREALGAMAAQLDGGIAAALAQPERQPAAAVALLGASRSPENAASIAAALRRGTERLKTDGAGGRDSKIAAEALLPLARLGSAFKNKDMAKAAADAKKAARALGAEDEAVSVDVRRVEWIPVLSLRPMQFEVGMREVAEKARKLQSMTPDEQRDYLLKHPIPVVRRKNGSHHVNKGPMARREFRPDDHHHLARAAWEAGIEMIPIVVEKEAKPGKKGRKFWKKMRKENLVYLYDQFGNGPHEPSDLPLDVRGLADDPYRSLAGKVRDLGGYDKTHEPFAEFRWANYFRKLVKTHPNDDFDQAVKEALALARDRRAKGLPGYKRRK